MIDKRQLLSIAVLRGYTQTSLAKAISMGENTIGRKLNGSASFTTQEIETICNILEIHDPKRKGEIFLSTSSPIRDDCVS